MQGRGSPLPQDPSFVFRRGHIETRLLLPSKDDCDFEHEPELKPLLSYWEDLFRIQDQPESPAGYPGDGLQQMELIPSGQT
jgi:hypothetical protein